MVCPGGPGSPLSPLVPFLSGLIQEKEIEQAFIAYTSCKNMLHSDDIKTLNMKNHIRQKIKQTKIKYISC